MAVYNPCPPQSNLTNYTQVENKTKSNGYLSFVIYRPPNGLSCSNGCIGYINNFRVISLTDPSFPSYQLATGLFGRFPLGWTRGMQEEKGMIRGENSQPCDFVQNSFVCKLVLVGVMVEGANWALLSAHPIAQISQFSREFTLRRAKIYFLPLEHLSQLWGSLHNFEVTGEQNLTNIQWYVLKQQPRHINTFVSIQDWRETVNTLAAAVHSSR